MTSTNVNIGIEGRSSSRIMKPPGGDHSDIFGKPIELSASRHGKSAQKSSISECFVYDNIIESKPVMQITNEDCKNGNDLIIEEKSTKPVVEKVELKQQKLRVPPGGYSSGFW